MEQDTRVMYSLAIQLLCCRKPSASYPIFLYEQLYLFQLRVIQVDKPYQINNLRSFLKAYSNADSTNQHLLCELYLHEYICMMDGKFTKTPYVGDIQLHAFASYVPNQVRWEIGHLATEQNEKNVTLWVRGELTPPYDIWRQQAALLSSFKVVSAITDSQEEAITSCLDTIRRNQTSVVLSYKLRWKVSSKVLKSKDPFNPSNFI